MRFIVLFSAPGVLGCYTPDNTLLYTVIHWTLQFWDKQSVNGLVFLEYRAVIQHIAHCYTLLYTKLLNSELNRMQSVMLREKIIPKWWAMLSCLVHLKFRAVTQHITHCYTLLYTLIHQTLEFWVKQNVKRHATGKDYMDIMSYVVLFSAVRAVIHQIIHLFF